MSTLAPEPPGLPDTAPLPLAPSPAPPQPAPPPLSCIPSNTPLSPDEIEHHVQTVASLASYPDWWERATAAVEAEIDPDGMLAFWGNGQWLQEGVLGIVGAIVADIPHRQQAHCTGRPQGIAAVSPDVIARLDAAPCFPQRTPGWFMDRHMLISASVAWKAISSDAALAALIREKLVVPTPNMADPAANPTSPLHWGQKYEPVSTALYSEWFGAEVREYGCIRHPVHGFLGASPDGVVVSEGEMYGRMLEIKNVVNRELTGIPKREYWIQMQMQMEACDLPLCDFFECRFVEYPTWSEADADGTFTRTADGKRKGALLMLFDEEAKRIRYFYPPLAITERSEYEAWERTTRDTNPGMTWMQRIRWRLDEHSLVTVERNRAWFASVLERFRFAWAEVLRAREMVTQAEDGVALGELGSRAGPGPPRDIDSRGCTTEHGSLPNARGKAQWPHGTSLIRQDSEEDDVGWDGPDDFAGGDG